MVLLEICLTSTYFVFQEKYYRLSDGVAMGSPVSSVVANLFMERLEKDALRPAGGDPGLDHLQKYFFDSLCFLEWTWPF